MTLGHSLNSTFNLMTTAEIKMKKIALRKECCEKLNTFSKIEESIKQTVYTNVCHLSHPVCVSTREFCRNKAMFSEGEDRYLKDLDCVNIVKSLRELRALVRIILNQQQRQILEFERESVIPSNKLIKNEESEFIQNKVPFEYSGLLKQDNYHDMIGKFVDDYSQQSLTKIDVKIINEILREGDNSSIEQKKPESLGKRDTQHDSRIRPKLRLKDDPHKWD